MTGSRVLLIVLSVVTAIVLQAAVLSRLTFLGARPDLLLVVVVCFALHDGPLAGTVTGFGAGLTADLLSDHVVGVLALALCVAGWCTGTVRDWYDRLSTLTPLVIVAVASAAVTVFAAGFSQALGDPRISWSVLAADLPLVCLYDVLLTPFVFSAIAALTRRTESSAREW